MVDYEGELGVVVGQRIRSVREEDALASVLGYLAVNDVSARDVQNRTSQWTLGKSFDTFAPTGPFLVTADEIDDPQALDIATRLNGVEVQRSNTKHMIFDVATLVSLLSDIMTLEPGDIIATGTPSGIGAAQQSPAVPDRRRRCRDRHRADRDPSQPSRWPPTDRGGSRWPRSSSRTARRVRPSKQSSCGVPVTTSRSSMDWTTSMIHGWPTPLPSWSPSSRSPRKRSTICPAAGSSAESAPESTRSTSMRPASAVSTSRTSRTTRSMRCRRTRWPCCWRMYADCRSISHSSRTETWDSVGAGPIRRLAGLTLGVLGFGRIGQATTRKAIGLGMKAVVHDNLPVAGVDPRGRRRAGRVGRPVTHVRLRFAACSAERTDQAHREACSRCLR